MSSIDAEVGERLLRHAMQGDEKDCFALIDAVEDPAEQLALVNYASPTGGSHMTALIWAAAEGYASLVSRLLDAGARISDANNTGMGPLAYALDNLPHLYPKELPSGGFPGDPTRVSSVGQVAYRNDGRGGDGKRDHVGVVKLLLARGAKIGDATNVYGEGLLHVAARRGYLGLVELGLGMTEPGSVDAVSQGYKHTPLHLAAMEDRADIVNYLVKEGNATVDVRNVLGWTPLMWAAASGNVRAVEALLAAGADPNAEGQEGADRDKTTTPLKEARKCREPKAVSSLLIRAGAI